jgi:hypothetical protein
MRAAVRSGAVLTTFFALVILGVTALQAQSTPAQTPQPIDPKTITEIDAGLGPCSADFTVNDSSGSPIYNAKIRLHIAYGRLNLHKLDLEAGTNAGGKARFIGLPDKSKEGLFFRASAGTHETSVFDNPSQTCKKAFTVVVERKSP